jgi:hypothetical protein
MVCHFVKVYADPGKCELEVFPLSNPDAGGISEAEKIQWTRDGEGPKSLGKRPFQAEKNVGRCGKKSPPTRLAGDFDVQSTDRRTAGDASFPKISSSNS